MGNVDSTAPDHKVNCTLKDVKVGDILFLDDGQLVPADCVLLAVRGTANNLTQGYIQTAQLDGERNLKPKIPLQCV